MSEQVGGRADASARRRRTRHAGAGEDAGAAGSTNAAAGAGAGAGAGTGRASRTRAALLGLLLAAACAAVVVLGIGDEPLECRRRDAMLTRTPPHQPPPQKQQDSGSGSGSGEAQEPWPAIVLGATGATGRKIVAQLAADAGVSGVTAVVRRQLTAAEVAEKFGLTEAQAAKVSQHVVDFERVAGHEASVVPAGGAAAGAHIQSARAFCLLGTTKAKAGSAEAFRRVDYDYVLESAKQLREAGVPHLTLMTSQGSNKDSSFLYPRTKGEVEAAVADLGFPRFSVFRPGLLLTDRSESRPLEFVMQKLWPNWALPASVMAPKTEQVAAAMVANAKGPPRDPEQKVEIYENADIIKCRVGPPAAKQ